MRRAVLSMVTLALSAGCSGATPTATAPSDSAAPHASSSPATSAATPSPSASTAASGVPAAAKANTPAGARAFVSYFMSQINVAWTKPDASALSGLCDLTSKSCAALNEDAADLVSQGRRYTTPPATVTSVESLPDVAGEQRVLMKGQQNKASIVDASGAVVDEIKQETSAFVFYVQWKRGSWFITEIKTSI